MKRLIPIFAVAILCMLAGGADAQPTAQAASPSVYSFLGWPPGTYHVTIVIGADGEVMSIGSIDVVQLPVPPVTPTDTDDPPDPTDPLSIRVAELLATAPSNAGQRAAVSRLYKSVGEIDGIANVENLNSATDTLFGAVNFPAEWVAWKSSLDAIVKDVTDVNKLKAIWLQVGGLK